MANAARLDFDQHFPVTHLWNRYFLYLQLLMELVDHCCFHLDLPPLFPHGHLFVCRMSGYVFSLLYICKQHANL
ncbi:hypothetical protein EN829_039500 [Mesorhizobium sp. M00.F.Ca.ET.186.01.1.1]|nr:hypothetical protein EN829_039500 [Mesorhizobium sp. M00.F.Ca.ET.186.01.1.1]